MANYHESQITGTKYTRAFRAEFENQLHQTPSVRFHEEDVAVLSDGSAFKTPGGSVDKAMTDPLESFPIIDAEGNDTGRTATLGDVQELVVSLYYHLALQRDVANAG